METAVLMAGSHTRKGASGTRSFPPATEASGYSFTRMTLRRQSTTRFSPSGRRRNTERYRLPQGHISNRYRGIFAFVSNLKENAKEVYLDYKGRWGIENCFDYMKNTVAKKSLYARNDETIYAQCFINHGALLYFYTLMRAIDKAGMGDEHSSEEIIKRVNNIYKISEHIGHKQLTEMTKEDAEIFKRLGVDL